MKARIKRLLSILTVMVMLFALVPELSMPAYGAQTIRKSGGNFEMYAYMGQDYDIFACPGNVTYTITATSGGSNNQKYVEYYNDGSRSEAIQDGTVTIAANGTLSINGAHSCTLTGTNNAWYYTWESEDGIATFTFLQTHVDLQQDATYSVTGATKTYNGSAQDLTSKSGAGGTIHYRSKFGNGSFSDWSTTAPKGTDAGTYTIQWYSDANDSYFAKGSSGSPQSCTATINTKAMTVSANDYTGTYDGAEHSFTISVTDPGSGATIKYGTSSGTYNLTAKPAYKDAGTHTVYYQVTKSNYTTKTGSVTVKINKKDVTVSGYTAEDKVYDGTTTATLGGTPAVSGAIDGESLDFTASGGNFSDADVGAYKEVTVAGNLISPGETNVANYNVSSIEKPTASITKRQATVTAINQSIELNAPETDYGLPLRADITAEAKLSLAASAVGLASGHKLTSIVLTPNVGVDALTTEGRVMPSAAQIKSGSTDVTANYEISYADAGFVVTKVKAVPNAALVASEITYGQKLSDSNLSAGTMKDKYTNDPVEGAFAWENPNIVPNVSDSDTTDFNVIFTPNDTGSYDPSIVKVRLTVNKVHLDATADDKTMVYNHSSEVPTLTYKVEGLVNGDVAADVMSGGLSTTATTRSTAGTYPIEVGTLAPNGNYTMSFVEGTLTIRRAAQAAPESGLGYSISGGRIVIASGHNSAANNETVYEVYDGENYYTHSGGNVAIEDSKNYSIRWGGSSNYNPSAWTPIITTATVTVRLTPEEMGYIEGLSEDGKYTFGETATLRAVPTDSAIYKFVEWQDGSGNTVSTSESYSFEVKSDRTLKAVFAEKDKTVAAFPTAVTGLTYDNGNLLVGVNEASEVHYTWDEESVLSATSAGVYTATATLDEHCVWPDGTDKPLKISWKIDKLSQVKPVVTPTSREDTFTIPTDKPVEYSTDGKNWTEVSGSTFTGEDGKIYMFRYAGNENTYPSPATTVKVNLPVTIETKNPSALTDNSVTLNGSVSDKTKVSAVRFEYKAAGEDNWTPVPAAVNAHFSTNIVGLTANTDYVFRAVAVLASNSTEIVGSEVRFKTAETAPPVGSIAVSVTSDSNRDVRVSIEEGNTELACENATITLPANPTATVTFGNLEDGFYNVVVRTADGDFTETRMIEVANGGATATVFEIPVGKLATVVEVKTADTPKVAVEGLGEMIGASEKNDAAAGKTSTEVKLEVEKMSAAAAEGADEISNLDDNNIETFLDMSLLKTTAELDGAGNETSITTEDIGASNTRVVEIAIPYSKSLLSRVGFAMYRFHSGMAEILGELATKPIGGFADGTFYLDKEGGYIFLYASGFSTYAIGFPPTGSSRKAAVDPATQAAITTLAAVASPIETGVADWLITDEHISYISGYSDGRVIPTGNITRAEVAVIFHRLLKNKDVKITKEFGDVKAGIWYEDAVKTLASLGIITGYEDNNFYPDKQISRAEFAAMATRFAKATGGKAGFTDVDSRHWAYGNVATAADYGWVNGYKDGTFGPAGKITRAEVATIVNHMLGRSADKAYVLANGKNLKQFSDLKDTNMWYYFDMVEAINGHDFTLNEGVETWK